jgi:hypothetical protein
MLAHAHASVCFIAMDRIIFAIFYAMRASLGIGRELDKSLMSLRCTLCGCGFGSSGRGRGQGGGVGQGGLWQAEGRRAGGCVALSDLLGWLLLLHGEWVK